MTLAVAPRARIRRDAHTQRPHLPWALDVAAGLARGASTADEAVARAELESRLGWLRSALQGSPYYVRVLMEAGLHPGDLQRLEDLRHFPALDRATLARHWEDVPTLPAASDECVVVKSSGTTGDPVNVLRDRRDCLLMWAVLRFFTEHTGTVPPPRPRVVLLDALPGGLEYSVRLPLFHDGALHRVSVLRDDAVARLQRVRAAVVFSDPEGLRWLLAHPEVPAPRLVLTSAQHLPRALRDAWEHGRGVPVLNYYAATETGPLAWECREDANPGRFHVLTPDVWLEPDGDDVVVTRLRPGVLPLLRYRPGDTGTVRRDACACGFHGWTLTGFGGRGACVFHTPTGRAVDAWSLAWVFKHHPLRAFRLTQVSLERFTLELAGAPADSVGPLRERLTAALRNLGWSAPVVDMEARGADALPPSAKPLPFRSELPPPG
ncbi:coenzyme synthetase [Corallococcus praedator]|uniref:Coenzyme synthetase n=1 Tax=Corallococcus praedator TaxID=2316724 RepID=A0ABX9QBB0_9BACT|nr:MULTISPECIES: AMP-binding protein [Corallococcus]RKH23048.1 coenzyme synthetase [Corallococcus sp. CA031C]RKH99845.1 coenzyme synthetase [Corallococcus praedator]